MKKHWRSLFVLVLTAALAVSVYPTVKGYWREWRFDPNSCSPAEEAVMAFSQSSGTPYRLWPESLIALLERNPEAEDFVLSYPAEYGQEHTVELSEYLNSDSVPLFLQWDKRWGYLDYGDDVAGLTGCGPVCLSMVAFYLTKDPAMSPDNLIRFALEEGYCSRGNGSSWTLISEGAGKLGLCATELPLVEGMIRGYLETGAPIICAMGPGDFTTTGHFIVLTGLEDGKLRVNDPNSVARSEALWEYEQISGQIRNLWVVQKP